MYKLFKNVKFAKFNAFENFYLYGIEENVQVFPDVGISELRVVPGPKVPG